MTDLSQIPTEDLIAFKAGNLSAVSTPSLIALRDLGTSKPVQPSSQNFFQRVGGDFQKRYDTAQEDKTRMKRGQQGALLTGAMMTGNAAGFLGKDVIGEGITSIGRGINNLGLGYPAKAASATLNAVGSIPDPWGGTIGGDLAQGIDSAKQGYGQFKQAHPVLARSVESAGDAGAFLANAGPASALAAGTVKKVGSAVPSFGTKPLSREAETAAFKKSASNLYKESAAEDIQLPDQEIDKLHTSLSSLQPKTDLEIRSWSSSGAAKHVQDITNSIETEKPSFNGLLAKRSELNSEIKVATRAGNDAEAFKLNRVKDALDDTMMGADSKTWQMANHQWAQHAVLDDMDEIVNKALTRAQPANSLDTAINNYLYSHKAKSLPDKEWEALKDVTNNSSFDKLRKGAASGLTKYAAAAVGSQGGPVGATAGYLMGHYGSEFSKDSAIASKVQKLDKFRDMVAARKPPTSYPVAETAFEPPKNITQKMKANRGKK